MTSIRVSLYKAYKEDTAQFLEWLARSALACGYKRSPTETPSEVTLHQKMQVKYIVTTKEMLAEAEAVAGKLPIPSNILESLERAIDVRRRYSMQMKKSTRMNKVSDKGHQYFIELLERAMSILLFPPTKPQQGVENTTTTSPIASSSESSAPSSGPTSGPELELEEPEENKTSMMLFCYFEELHRIQKEVRRVWEDCRDKKVDIITASFITNVALDLVRDREIAIMAEGLEIIAHGPYTSMAYHMICANSIAHGQDPAEKFITSENLRIDLFDEFIYRPTANILLKFETVHRSDKYEYPIDALPMSIAYEQHAELLEGEFMTQKLKEDKLLSQVMMDARLYDSMKQEAMKSKNASNVDIMASQTGEDDFQKGIRQYMRDGVLHVWIVFACQIFLDVHELLGDEIRRGYGELLTSAQHIKKVIAQTTHESMPTQSRIRVTSEAYEVFEGVDMTCDHWISHNALEISKAKILKATSGKMEFGLYKKVVLPTSTANSAKLRSTNLDAQVKKAKSVDVSSIQVPSNWLLSTMSAMSAMTIAKPLAVPSNVSILGAIKYDSDPKFYFAHNPWFCGMAALGLAADYAEATMMLNFQNGSALLMAHLYTEVRRTGHLVRKWPEMDQFIALQANTLFGSKLPQSAGEAVRKYTECVSSTKFPSNSDHYDRLPIVDISRLLLREERPFYSVVAQLEPLLRTGYDNKTMEEPAKGKGICSQESEYSSIELLAALKNHLPAELAKLKLDYLSLAKVSSLLIGQCLKQIETKLQIPHHVKNYDWSYSPEWRGIAQKILEEEKQELTEKEKEKGRQPQGRQLKVIATILYAYLKAKA